MLLNSQTEQQLFWLEETTLAELVYFNQLKNTQDHMILLILRILLDKLSQPDFQMLSLLEMEKLQLFHYQEDKELNLLQFKKETLDLAEKKKLLKLVKKMIETIWFHISSHLFHFIYFQEYSVFLFARISIKIILGNNI